MMQDDLSAKPQRSHLAIVVGWSLCAVVSFHLAYGFAIGAPVIILFFLSLLQLAQIASARETIYFGWIIGLCIYGPQLFFFWSIFHQAAIFLWLILATWLALYLLLQRFALARFGVAGGILTAPFLWMGIEYYRSEMYPLRFSWLNAGYLSPSLCHWAGMYGAGVCSNDRGWFVRISDQSAKRGDRPR